MDQTSAIRELIRAKTQVVNDCWVWQGQINKNGYGVNHFGQRTPQYVHRVSYEAFTAPIPDGLVIDHLCRNRACCNPAHLEPVTQRENLLRGMSPMARAIRTGICIRGHDRTAPNAVLDGGRCRKCKTEDVMRRRNEREAANPALREERLRRLREADHRRRRRAAEQANA